MKSDTRGNEAVGLLSKALLLNDYPNSYLAELTNFLGISPASSALLTPRQKNLLQHLLRALEQQAPVEYLVGEAMFFNRRFRINRDVLIPRFDTEKLVTQALELAEKVVEPLTIIDIGTGSGVLIISLAKELATRSNIEFWATDISPAALKVAQENAGKYDVEKRIKFQLSDVYPRRLDGSPAIPKTKHVIIVSNPPYISNKQFERLPASVKNYEPALALKEQPNFLFKVWTYLDSLRSNRIMTDLFIEYNDNNGIAQFHHLYNPTNKQHLENTVRRSSTEIAV